LGIFEFEGESPLTQDSDIGMKTLNFVIIAVLSGLAIVSPSVFCSMVSAQGLQDLPNGNYVYREVKATSRLDSSRYFVFRKVGVSVIGKHFQPHTDWVYCFKGELRRSTLINVVQAEPRFGRGTSGFDFKKGKPENLNNYQSVNFRKVTALYPKTNQGLQECINLFQ
jgi:hypothetical protein